MCGASHRHNHHVYFAFFSTIRMSSCLLARSFSLFQCLMFGVFLHGVISHFICNSLYIRSSSVLLFFLLRLQCAVCVVYWAKWIYVGIRLKNPNKCAFVRVKYESMYRSFLYFSGENKLFSLLAGFFLELHSAIFGPLLLFSLLIALAVYQSRRARLKLAAEIICWLLLLLWRFSCRYLPSLTHSHTLSLCFNA